VDAASYQQVLSAKALRKALVRRRTYMPLYRPAWLDGSSARLFLADFVEKLDVVRVPASPPYAVFAE
jgi:hypothetical protein